MVSLVPAVLMVSAVMASSEPSFTTTRPPMSTIQPSPASIAAAQFTVKPSSPTSNVSGVAFDRIVQIWLENTAFDVSLADPNMQALASQGILLTNFFAVSHPSEPNYAAVVAGDIFGMDNDNFNSIPANISTIVDLLDTKSISWGEYQENIPYPGFPGFNYSSPVANVYVRKHNPLILFDSLANNSTRASQIKSLTSLDSDLVTQTLPQWVFITPNMEDDGHDTNITFAASWLHNFLKPLMKIDYFMNNTLIVVSFDESEVYSVPNRVYTLLLGGAIPSSLWGTTDSMYYNHYSMISTVSLNWGLPSLGRWDCGANVLALVANKTGYSNLNISLDNLYFNASYAGPLSDKKFTPGWWAAPNTVGGCVARSILPGLAELWGESPGALNYTNVYPYDADSGTGVFPPTPTAGKFAPLASSSSAGSTSPSDDGAFHGLSTGAKTGIGVGVGVGVPLLLGLVAFWFWRWRRHSSRVTALHDEPGHRARELDGRPVTEVDSHHVSELHGKPLSELP
jgi:acid phosphatase